VRALSSSLPEAEENERAANTIRMEESFTIHLGRYVVFLTKLFFDVFDGTIRILKNIITAVYKESFKI
jgi:hypothetical protein